MTLPYRTRRALRRLAYTALFLLLAAVLIWMCWLLWLDRYVVFTRDGAVLDFDLPNLSSQGEIALPPEENTVSIYYNDGEDAVNTSTELTQVIGYYADTAALTEDIAAVADQIAALPKETPVMLDVKNIYGKFYYSSSLGDTASGVDSAAMDELISQVTASGRYVIARVPALRDREYGLHHVSDGLPLPKGYLWVDEDRTYWLNPTKEGTMTYLMQIAGELKNLGFDEVVFSDFRFPDTNKIVFKGDKKEALTNAAASLVSACATDTFAVSFGTKAGLFPLPEGRSRLYLEGIAAEDVKKAAQEAGLADPLVHLVFLTETNDTRFEEFGVLRPISTVH